MSSPVVHRAAILSIGDELLSGITLNTNTAWIASELATRGIVVGETRTLPDDQPAISCAIAELTQSATLLFITGGLGPTADDLTREALAEVTTPGQPLEIDASALHDLEQFFMGRGKPMPDINRKQATRPRIATFLENPNGTAPGLRIEHNDCTIVAMPGVPREMKPMLIGAIESIVQENSATESERLVLRKRSVHIFGLGESSVAEKLGSLLSRDQQPGNSGDLRIGTTSSRSIVSVRIYARGTADKADAASERVITEVKAKCRPHVFGVDDETLPAVLGSELQKQNKMIATVESCTGGMVGELLTDVPGSSAWYAGGWVTYTNEAKARCVGVDAALIESFGAVSKPVAAAMAAGALAGAEESANVADIAISITGIAGPGGGSASKPVGTVYIGCAHRERLEQVTVRKFLFKGDRAAIRRWAALMVIQMARFELLGISQQDELLLGEVLPQSAAIALGANLGNREANIARAVELLGLHPEIEVSQVSSNHETVAVGPGNQPDYLNAAATITTTLSPRALLDVCLDIEQSIGRERSLQQRWGPRVIDLDVVLFGREVIDEPGLTIPHPNMHDRDFVLQPLSEIAADWSHPKLGKSIDDLCRVCER